MTDPVTFVKKLHTFDTLQARYSKKRGGWKVKGKDANGDIELTGTDLFECLEALISWYEQFHGEIKT